MASVTGITGATAAAVTATDIQAALNGTILDVYSARVLMYALPRLVHMQFARKEQDLTKEKGDTIKFHRFAPIKPGGALDEGVPMTAVTMDHSTTTITVKEYGNKIQLTERLTATTALKIMDIAAQQLADDFAVLVEVEQVRVLRTLPSVMFANEKANRAALVAGDKMSCQTLRAAGEMLSTANVPRIPLFQITAVDGKNFVEYTGEWAYVLFITERQARSLKEDTDWKANVTSNHNRYVFAGEIGMYDGVIPIKTNLQPIIKATTGNIQINGKNYSDAAVVGAKNVFAVDAAPRTFDVHEAYMLGDYTWGFAEAQPVQLRDDVPEDLGRLRALGWYAIQGQGLINPQHGLRIETA